KVFTVEPGVAPDTIRVRVAGTESLAVAGDGGLVLHTGGGDVRLTPPVAYQEIAGTRRVVPVQYAISGDEYGFRVTGYDPTSPVVIDPLLQATPLGGSDVDDAFGLAIGPAGDVYVAGSTASFDFPGTAAGAQRRLGGGSDAYVARLIEDLTGFEEVTFLGGSGDDRGRALAIEPTTGDVFVAGRTESVNFPGTNGGAQSALSGDADAFVARLNANLTALEQATYLGGSVVRGSGSRETVTALAIAPATGDVYVTGPTESADFPGTSGGAQGAFAGGVLDTYVARLNAGLTTLEQATYLGGDGNNEIPFGLAIAPTTGDVYVVGHTDSDDFPGTQGGAQSTFGGGAQAASIGVWDGFVARLNASLTSLEQATYLGGSNFDEADAVAIAPTTGDVYISGFTESLDFPGTTGGAQSAHAADAGNHDDAFVARLNAALTSLDQATYLGGNGSEFADAIQLTPSEVYVAGQTRSTDFPGTRGGAQAAPGGGSDAFVARLNANLSALDQATYFGGGLDDGVFAFVMAPTTRNVYIAGFTLSPVLPGTAGAAQGGFGGAQDAFVALLSADLSSTPTTTTTSSSTTTTRPPTTTTTTTRPTTTSTSSTTSSTTTTRPTTTTTSSTTTSSTTTTTLVVANTPPTVSIDDLPAIVKRTDLGSGRLLTLHLTVSEPATITLDILNGRGTSLRQTTLTRTSAGSFAAQISLRHVRGNVTLRVTATDAQGASSVVQQQFRVQ
ncbi:MAG TPA: hypothetical protein VKE97_00540, partial [Acidimicrobiia bacterium]|nr:hypothetical protein [Acidimicrobiia bacterium]